MPRTTSARWTPGREQKISAPEEIAGQQGFTSNAELEALAHPLVKSGYGAYLLELLH